MSYRDDTSAILARAHAIEEELERTREALSARDAEIGALRAKVASADDEPATGLQRQRPRTEPPPPPPARRTDPATVAGTSPSPWAPPLPGSEPPTDLDDAHTGLVPAPTANVPVRELIAAVQRLSGPDRTVIARVLDIFLGPPVSGASRADRLRHLADDLP